MGVSKDENRLSDTLLWLTFIRYNNNVVSAEDTLFLVPLSAQHFNGLHYRLNTGRSFSCANTAIFFRNAARSMFGFSPVSSTAGSDFANSGTSMATTQDSAAAAAAAAMAAMAAGGIAPTDPRIQPFIRIAREEYTDLRVRVLVSNGMSEPTARQEVERSMPSDRSYFFGQALLKYLSSLAGGHVATGTRPDALAPQSHEVMYGSATAQACFYGVTGGYTPPVVSLAQSQIPQSCGAVQSIVAGEVSSAASPVQETAKGLNLGPLQRLLEGHSGPSGQGSVSSHASRSAVANVLAAAQSNLSKTKSTRFDIASETPTPAAAAAVAAIPCASFQLQPSIGTGRPGTVQSVGGTQQQLDKALQQWTYCVYSMHQTPPPGIDPKAWRAALFQFVNQCVASAHRLVAQQAQTYLSPMSSATSSIPVPSFPAWLVACQIPTADQILQPHTFAALAGQHLPSSSSLTAGNTSLFPYVGSGPAPPPSSSCSLNSVPPPPPALPVTIQPKSINQIPAFARRSTESRKNGLHLRSQYAHIAELSPVSSSGMSNASTSEDETEHRGKRSPTHRVSNVTRGSRSKGRRSVSRCSSSMSNSSSSSSSSSLSEDEHSEVIQHQTSCLGTSSQTYANSLFSSQAQLGVDPSAVGVRSYGKSKKKARYVVHRLPGVGGVNGSIEAPTVDTNAGYAGVDKRGNQHSRKTLALLAKNKSGIVSGKGKQAFLFSNEEYRRREDRSRRFFGSTSGVSATAASETDDILSSNSGNVPLLSSEGLRMMTWREKLAMLTSVERIVGKSQMLEKPYLRLCGPPDPALVRSEKALVRSFRHCVDKWNRERNYRFIEEQFRSIRQDLTVQGIKNAFTVTVYEANAKIALENFDLGQFNQCQTQLRELHKALNVPIKDREEFLCYRILYLALTNMQHDSLKLSGELTQEEKELPAVKFADRCRRALIEGNCHRLFRLTASGPYLTSKLFFVFLNRLRMTYLVLIARSHYVVPLSFLKRALMFDSPYECRRFLQENKAVWTGESMDAIDCRKSLTHFESSPLLQSRKVKALG